jgi:hypothetical protein
MSWKSIEMYMSEDRIEMYAVEVNHSGEKRCM